MKSVNSEKMTNGRKKRMTSGKKTGTTSRKNSRSSLHTGERLLEVASALVRQRLAFCPQYNSANAKGTPARTKPVPTGRNRLLYYAGCTQWFRKGGRVLPFEVCQSVLWQY
jgi:hypothetical protein